MNPQSWDGTQASEGPLSTERLSTLDKSPFHHRAETNNHELGFHQVLFISLLYVTAWFSLCSPAWCLGWMPIAASHVPVKWHPSIAERCSAIRESPINHEEQSLKLSGWIKESWTCFASNSCWHFYRLRQRWMQTVAVGGEEQRETQEEHVQTEFLAGGLEWAYFSMSCWVRGIFLFFMQDPMSSQHLFSYKRVKQESSCLKANQSV